MKKQVFVEQLKFGVYIHELDRPWTETPFMYQGFVLNSEAQLQALKKYCKKVFIDTDKGEDVAENPFKGPAIPPTSVLSTIKERTTYVEKAPFHAELPLARQTTAKTAGVIKDVFSGLQAGKALDAPRVKEAVTNMTDSVVRNPDAMLLLAKMKEQGDSVLDRAMGVSIYMITFGRFLHLPREQLDMLGMLGLLQDVGKLKLPAGLLNKKDPLSDAELNVCKSHVRHSVATLRETTGLPPELPALAALHHERVDGSGYPAGLKGMEIGLFGGIAGLVDCFDALTGPRPYGQALAPSNALNMIYDWRDSQFDGPLVEQFIQCIGIYPVGALVELYSGEIGIVIAQNQALRLFPKVMVVLDSKGNKVKPQKTIDRAQVKRTLEKGAVAIDASEFFPSDGGADGQDRPEAEGGLGLRALVGRLAEEFGADSKTLAAVAAVFEDVRERAPDLFVQAAGALAPAFAANVASGGSDDEPVYAALGEWALDAEGEPIERMRRDCLRFQSAMTRGVLRLHGGDAERCGESLQALQRFIFLQLGLLASLAARGQEGGGVVRTLPTPEYAAFMEIFRTTIESHRQEGRQLGLLLLQVGRIEQVDRLLGLQRGEAFMLRVIRRMREGVLRRQDQLGRVSRDQLACLLPGIAGEGVSILAANKILGTLEAPIPIGDRSFDPDAVIGIAVYPDHGEDQQTLVRNGKLAAAAAREAGERFAVYDPAHGAGEELKMRYAARLRRSLEDDAFRLAFEPQLELASGRITGLEGVLRWTDDELGEVPEAQTAEAAETAGLTREVTWWMFNSFLRQCGELARAGLDLPVSLKVSASGFAQPDFTEFVDRALRTWGVVPGRLTIEIHESALAGGIEQVKEALARLKALGLRLGVGGFGTGSSSLASLAQLPFDEMKLDATFVRDMTHATSHAKIVRSLVQLAQNLGFAVTAEGVADAATAQALAELGCERIEGAYVGEPLTAQEVLTMPRQKSLAQGAA